VPYRTPPEKKTVQKRIVLTRDEVVRIVRAHLQAKGLHPQNGDEHTRNRMVAMQVVATPGIEMAKDAPWGSWPSIYFEWDEDAPAADKVESTNDEGM
jgi:hypothetical protein